MVGLKNWLKSSRILQFLSKLVLQNNLIAHYCFFKQTTEMSICHCLSVKKRVSVKNVKILEMSDFGNSGIQRGGGPTLLDERPAVLSMIHVKGSV